MIDSEADVLGDLALAAAERSPQVSAMLLDEMARATAMANAEILRTNSRWIVTIEGHCDERRHGRDGGIR